MAATGESYQATFAKVVAEPGRGKDRVQNSLRAPWLLRASYFGVPVTLAVYQVLSRASLILVSGCGGPIGLPLAKASPLHLQAGTFS